MTEHGDTDVVSLCNRDLIAIHAGPDCPEPVAFAQFAGKHEHDIAEDAAIPAEVGACGKLGAGHQGRFEDLGRFKRASGGRKSMPFSEFKQHVMQNNRITCGLWWKRPKVGDSYDSLR